MNGDLQDGVLDNLEVGSNRSDSEHANNYEGRGNSLWATPPSTPRLANVVTPDNSENMQLDQFRDEGSCKVSGTESDDLHSHRHVVTPDRSMKERKGTEDETDDNSVYQHSSSPSVSTWSFAWFLATQLAFYRQLVVLLFTEIPAPEEVVAELNRSPVHRVEPQAVHDDQAIQTSDQALSRAERYVLKGSLAMALVIELVYDMVTFFDCQTNNDSLNDWLWAIIIVRMMLAGVMFAPSCVDLQEFPKQYDYLQYAYLGVLTRLVMNIALIAVEIAFFSIVPGMYKTRDALIVVLLCFDCVAVVRCLILRCWKVKDYHIRYSTSLLLHFIKLVFAWVIVADFYRNDFNTNFIPGLCVSIQTCIFLLKFAFPKTDKLKVLLAQLYITSMYGLVYSCGFKQLCKWDAN